MNRDHVRLLLLVLAFAATAVAWSAVVPVYENLDEIEHAEVVRHIAVTGRLPVHGDAEAAGYHVRQEASQPPLYHMLGALWVRLWGLPRDAPSAEPIPQTLVACGSGDTLYKRVTWRRDPYADLRADGHRYTTYVLRLFSTLLQGWTIVGTWSLAKRIAKRGPLPYLAAAIVAFNPQTLLVAAAVNNDNLVTPLATWTLVVLLDAWQRGPTPRRLLALGVLGGLATLSKLSGLGLLGLIGLTLAVYSWREHRGLRELVIWGLLVGTPALIIVAPWLLRNVSLYGDPTALQPMLAIVGRTDTRADVWGTLRLMVQSYWGQLPCTFYPRAVYWPFYLLLGGGIVTLLLSIKANAHRRSELAILCGWLVIIVGAWIRWNSLTPATGGRLLFPAAPALAVLLAGGWTYVHPRVARAWAVILPVGAIATLLAGPAPVFAPPTRLDATGDMQVPIAIEFGDGDILLRGYDVEITRPHALCRLNQGSPCEPSLDLSLYLEAPQPLAGDLVLSVQLVSARPGDTKLRLAYDAWPGHGNLPTSAWPAGVLLRERLRLPLAESAEVTQAWDVQVAFYDDGTAERLPVTLEGRPVGDAARLTALRVPGQAIACSETGRLEASTDLGGAVALTHALVEEGRLGWDVILCWESIGPLEADTTVFVHAYDAEGELIATGDGPPMAGAFPTRLWAPGDTVRDAHSLDTAMEPTTIAVGMYHPETGVRLTARAAGEQLPDDAVVIWQADQR